MNIGWLIGTFAVAVVYGWMMYTLGKDDGADEGYNKGYSEGFDDAWQADH